MNKNKIPLYCKCGGLIKVQKMRKKDIDLRNYKYIVGNILNKLDTGSERYICSKCGRVYK